MSILTPYKVLDLTDEKGWFCCKLLADLGAEVVRVQKPGESVSPVYANTGKHSVSLNFEVDKGKDLFLRLIKDFDVIVESYSPGYLASLRLAFADLKSSNGRLIMASITNFGQSGPYRNKQSSDLISGALGGQSAVNGDPGKPPLKPFGPQAYNMAGLFAANGVLLALLHRHSTGKGQYLDISVHECAAATLDHVLVRYFYNGTIAARTGSLYWNKAFRIFPCRDGYISLSFLQHFDTLVELLAVEGMAEDLKDPQWQDAAVRWQNSDHIIAVLEKWTRTHTADKLMELGQLMRLPWAKVSSIPEIVDNPQLNDRNFFLQARDAEGRSYKFPGVPVKMSSSRWNVNTQILHAGEYNEEIYHRRLGLTPAEIEELKEEGVI